MVQLWHCRASDLNSVLLVPCTMSALGITFRFWGSVIAVVVCFRYFAIYDFLLNFIWFFRQFYYRFSTISDFDTVVCSSILLLLYVCSLLFYKHYCTSALVCIWILFCFLGSSIYYQLSLGVRFSRGGLLVTSWLATFEGSTIIGHWIWGCSLFTVHFTI